MSDKPRTLTFKFDNKIAVTVHYKEQTADSGKPYRLEIWTPVPPARLTYEQWARFAQTVTALLNPRTLLED